MKIGAGGLQAMAAHDFIISRTNDGQIYLLKQREVGDDFSSDHIRIKQHELVTLVVKNLNIPELNKRRVKVTVKKRGKKTIFQFVDEETDEILLELDLEELYEILGEHRGRSGLVVDSKA